MFPDPQAKVDNMENWFRADLDRGPFRAWELGSFGASELGNFGTWELGNLPHIFNTMPNNFTFLIIFFLFVPFFFIF